MAEIFKTGDVIEDSYGNPAVVLNTGNGQPKLIMQTVGSDLGRITSAPLRVVRVTGGNVEWARNRARAEWTRRGLKKSQFPSS